MAADRQLERSLRRCRRFLDDNGIDPRGGWLVAVSGGPDSMALWRLAAALGQELGFRVEAAHVDHGIRSTSADEACQVRAHATSLGTPCHVVAVAVDQRGDGPEAAARKARYHALHAIRSQRGLAALATGHTADDQAETALMRILSGSGLRGVAAMRPCAEALHRPMLWMRRAETRLLAEGLGLPLVEDESNLDPRLLRGRLRQELLPLVEEVFGDPVPHLASLAAETAQLNDLVDQLLASCPVEPDGDSAVVGSRPQISALHPALRGRWLLRGLDALGCSPRRARAAVDRFAELVAATGSFSLDLSGVRVSASQTEVRLHRQQGRPQS